MTGAQNPTPAPDKFCFGRPLKGAEKGCCTKPVGCDKVDESCLFRNHPWKRAVILGDTTVRCPARSVDGQCVLRNRHDGPCRPESPASIEAGSGCDIAQIRLMPGMDDGRLINGA